IMDHPSPPKTKTPAAWILLAIALSFLASFLLLRSQLQRRPTGEPGRRRTADYNWKLVDLDGRPVEFSRYAGKPVFLNIWATWCGPCRREMPSIARLAVNPKLKDVAFLCVAIDEDKEEVRQYVRDRDLPMTFLLPAGPIPRVFLTDGIPATFLIAPDGRIVREEVGAAEWDDPEVIALLARLAQSAAGGS
ncbi:MAG: TlpA family protein disulfide reductase, partial [Isosphaeraceae bacterium]|nr:TlpA family protein disulfide reductase [Isosphaeraceae bacterium]